MHLFLLIGWVMLLAATGLAVGLRSSRRDFPGRLLITLAFYSALVGLAVWAIFGPEWSTQLTNWFGDTEGLATFLILGPIVVIGGVVLTPLWGYAAGRIVRWYRFGRKPTAQANAGLVGRE
jgi:hypothetical protein